MKIFGIDISVWQKGMNLTKAKNEGVKFAIIRGAHTGSANGKPKAKDTQFETHYKNAKAIGLGVGCYYFSRATSYSEGKEEALFLYNNCLKGKKFEYPIYIDVEDTTYQKKAGKEAVTNAIKGFCDTLEAKGYYVGVYASLNFIKNYMDYEQLRKKYDYWIALWNKNEPDKARYSYGMWQFGGETNKVRTNKVAGVTCDQNYAYKDYPKIMATVGLNGFIKPVPPVVEPPKEEDKPINNDLEDNTEPNEEDNTNTPVEDENNENEYENKPQTSVWVIVMDTIKKIIEIIMKGLIK